jgi:hypothetical protein
MLNIMVGMQLKGLIGHENGTGHNDWCYDLGHFP